MVPSIPHLPIARFGLAVQASFLAPTGQEEREPPVHRTKVKYHARHQGPDCPKGPSIKTSIHDHGAGLLGALFLLTGCSGGNDTGGETLGFVGAVDGSNAVVGDHGERVV